MAVAGARIIFFDSSALSRAAESPLLAIMMLACRGSQCVSEAVFGRPISAVPFMWGHLGGEPDEFIAAAPL
jgi:hypothetical protein